MNDDAASEFDTEETTKVEPGARAPKALVTTAEIASYWAGLWTARELSEKVVDAADDAG
jgi:hypothetical protein